MAIEHCRAHGPARYSVWALALMALPASAQFTGVPYAAVTLEHDSNVYRVADRQESVATTGSSKRSDDITKLAAGIDAVYELGPQRFFLNAEGRSYRYSRFDQIDNDGHLASGGLDWRVGPAFSGKVRLRSERRLQDFGDLRSNTPGNDRRGLVDNNKGDVSAAYNVTPQWQLQAGVGGERVRNTRFTSKDEDRNESSATVGLAYLGRPISSLGFEVQFTDGEYPNRNPAPGSTEEFSQVDYRLTATWRPSGISTLEAKFGGSRRNNDGIDVRDFSGVTGDLNYTRQISGKTRVNVDVFRRVSSVNLQDANFVVDQGGTLRLDWNVVRKADVVLGAFYYDEKYEGSPALNTASGSTRHDQVSGVDLRIKYRPVDWMVLSPVAAYETRQSNRDDGAIDNVEYDDARFGLELRLLLPS